MPFNRPDLITIRDRIQADMEAAFPGLDVGIRRQLSYALAKALTGAFHGVYGNLEWLSKQLIYDTAEADILERWASIWGLSRKVATKAFGNVTFTGLDGPTIAAGTTIQRADGAQFVTDAPGTIVSGTALIGVTAMDAGVGGNTVAATSLSLISPVVGIDASATVDGVGLTGGVDTEDDAALLARLLDRIQHPPHGGNRDDYVVWALQMPGVTRAWCSPQELGIGTVSVRFMMDETYVDGIPTQPDVDKVKSHIDALRPVTSDVTVVAPIANPIHFTIALTPGNGTSLATVKTAVEAELTDMIRRESLPAGKVLLSHINEAISIAAGEADHVLTLPSADVVSGTGEIPVMGIITWV